MQETAKGNQDMINVVISENFKLQENEEEIFSLDIGTIRQSLFDADKTLVYDADLNGITKDQLELVIANATRNIKIISSDYKIVDGKRSGKSLKIDKSDVQKETNPWTITEAMLTVVDRRDLFEYLKSNKVNLWMPLKIMTSNFEKLTPRNSKILEKLDQWFFKVQNEILYAMICFGMEAQEYYGFRWRFPKKGETK